MLTDIVFTVQEKIMMIICQQNSIIGYLTQVDYNNYFTVYPRRITMSSSKWYENWVPGRGSVCGGFEGCIVMEY